MKIFSNEFIKFENLLKICCANDKRYTVEMELCPAMIDKTPYFMNMN